MSQLVSPELLWLVEGLLAALLCGLVLALLLSLWLVASPGALLDLNRKLSRWIDTRPSIEALERPLMLERVFYRHHRVLGVATILGAGYVLWRWAVAWDRQAVVALLDRRWVAAGLDWVVAVVGLHVLILVAGIVILVRPSLLKGLEHTANRWHRGPSADRLDTVVGAVDRGVETHPRVAGVVLLLASTWSLLALLPVLLRFLGR
jgi:hypothetical protein